jgi:hypothetical protein
MLALVLNNLIDVDAMTGGFGVPEHRSWVV